MGFWASFRETFLTSGHYENLGSNSLISIPLIVVGLFVGIALAFVATVFTKRVLGELVRKLLAEKVFSSEEAKTLSELSLEKNIFLRRAVKGNVSLRRVVHCREEDEYYQDSEEAVEAEISLPDESEALEITEETPKRIKKPKKKPFRVNPKLHHFYIPEEYRDMASVKFDKKGTSWSKMIILLVILLVALILFLLFLPSLMEILNGFVGTMKNAVAEGSNKVV